MNHTYQGYVTTNWENNVDGLLVSRIRIDYPNEPSRVQAQSTNNITPDPNETLWFVQGQLSLFESLIADPNYEVVYIEEIVDGE